MSASLSIWNDLCRKTPSKDAFKSAHPLLFVKLYGILYLPVRKYASFSGIASIWGCRVSTDEQIEGLQAEVPVRTLVKQPAKK